MRRLKKYAAYDKVSPYRVEQERPPPGEVADKMTSSQIILP